MVRRIEAGGNFFVASFFNQFGKVIIHLREVGKQGAVFSFQAAYPAIGGGVGAGMPDHNRGFVFVGGIVAGNRGNLLGGNRNRAPAVVRASASAEDFMAHSGVSWVWLRWIMNMGSLKNF